MPSYSQYKRQLAVLDADDTDIEAWITVKGNHIPIKKGQSKEEAVKSFIESKNGGGKKSAGVPEDYKKSVAHYSPEKHAQAANFYGEKMASVQKKANSKTDPNASVYAKQFQEYQDLSHWHEEQSKNGGGKGAEPKMSKSDRWEKYHREKGNIKEGRPPKDWTKVEGALTAPNGYTWYSNNKSRFGGERESYLFKDEPKSKLSKPSSATGGGESTNASQHDLNRNGSIEHPYTFHEDAGHGWLAVPLGDLKGLNLDISTFSYTDGKYVYLEEDSDAPAFEKAYKEKYGVAPVSHEHYDGDRSDIRTMKSYKSEKKEEQQNSGGSINNIFQQANAGLQSFVDDTGYQPQTTFWSDFGIAEPFGEKAVEDTYNRAFREWKNDKVYLTELSMMLNWKLWQHYDKGNDKMARLYDKLWKQTDKYAHTHLKGDDLQYYIRTTD